MKKVFMYVGFGVIVVFVLVMALCSAFGDSECVTAPETESRIVYSFDKVTLAKGQVFRIYFYEDGGPRYFVLSFGMKDLNRGRDV